MRLLFEIDTKDYIVSDKVFIRPSVRAIIIKDNRVAMVHSIKYDYYKFPGGGIENGETHIDALIRETAEETGLIAIRDSVKEFGYVHRVQKSDLREVDRFIQDNYYYTCDVEDRLASQKLDDYELEEKFTLEFVDARYAIDINRTIYHGPKDQNMLEREARVLEILMAEGYLT